MQSSTSPRNVLAYIMAYVLWGLSLLVSVLTLYWLREAYLMSLVSASFRRGDISSREQFYQSLQVRAADQWSMFLAGLVLIILIVALEYYFRTGAGQGDLVRRFALVSGVLFGLMFLANLAHLLMERAVQPVTLNAAFTPALEAVVALIFLALWWFARKRALAAG